MAKKRLQSAGQELGELKRRLKYQEISKPELAFEFGYLCTETLDKWFRNNKIPARALPIVQNYLNRPSKERRA